MHNPATAADPYGLATVDSPLVGPKDRLLSTLLYALAVHLVLLLGLQFDLSLSGVTLQQPSLDITLVPMSDDQPPDQEDFLAQANQRGGGESDVPAKPTTVLQGETPVVAQQPLQAPVAELTETAHQPQPEKPLLAANQTSSHKVAANQLKEEKQERRQLSTASLMRQSRQFARLQAQLAELQNAAAKRPRRKIISAATKEYAPAAYMEAWRAKVERVGTMNYPEAARRAGISGSLRMAVEIRADGSVSKVEISRSSGYPVLDKAAIRVVNLAGPFAPLPTAITREAELLVIVRTWQFSEESVAMR
ncbi:MAG: TonB family protein [Gammaproteobacteria bacterium]